MGTAQLYSFYNDTTGEIQPDGKTVELFYQGQPAWVFTWPLTKPIPYLSGKYVPPGSKTIPVKERTGCSFAPIVDASSGKWIQAFQACTG